MGVFGAMNGASKARGATCVFPSLAIVLTAFAASGFGDEY
jgi:hypothetical protein